MHRAFAFGLLPALLVIGPAEAAPTKKAAVPGGRKVLALKREVKPGSKPTAPIEFIVEPAGAVQGGQALRVGARPLVPVADCRIRVAASDGLAITAGEAAWGGRPGARQPSARVIQVRAVGAGAQRVGITATITLPDGTQMTAYGAWVGRPAKLTLEQEFPGARTGKDRKGRSIIEVPVEP